MSFPKISFKRVSLKNFAEFIKNSYVRVFYSFSFTKTKDSGVFTAQFPADLVTFTEKIFNGKLHFLCSVSCEFCYFFPEQLVQNPCMVVFCLLYHRDYHSEYCFQNLSRMLLYATLFFF